MIDYGVENLGGAEISVLSSTRFTLDVQPDRLLELQTVITSDCLLAQSVTTSGIARHWARRNHGFETSVLT